MENASFLSVFAKHNQVQGISHAPPTGILDDPNSEFLSHVAICKATNANNQTSIP